MSEEKAREALICDICRVFGIKREFKHINALRSHIGKAHKGVDLQTISAIAERFRELETQFSDTRRAVDILVQETRSKPNLEDIRKAISESIAPIASRINEMEKRIPVTVVERKPAEEITEAPPPEAGSPAIPPEAEGALERLFGRPVSPLELGEFMKGLGTLIAATRGPGAGEGYQDLLMGLGKKVLDEDIKTMGYIRRLIARRMVETFGAPIHKAVHEK